MREPPHHPHAAHRPLRIAVIGAGLSGSQCAQALQAQGHAPHLFDKSRGVGGRMSTRRGQCGQWAQQPSAQAPATLHDFAFDHGAPGFSALDPLFQRFAQQAHAQGHLAPWAPLLAPHSSPLPAPTWTATPDMPALCRHLRGDIPLTLGQAIDALQRGPQGWQLLSAGQALADRFDRVVLALPAPQAATLLRAHASHWAEQAAALTMQACWTLMAIAEPSPSIPPWHACAPTQGPLRWIACNDHKPGRVRATPQHTHWVAQASASWSQAHLEDEAQAVETALLQSLNEALGQNLRWAHAAVHRWRYAQPAPGTGHIHMPCWWDSDLGLGVCGDFFDPQGNAPASTQLDIERAWLSAMALAHDIA